MILPRTLHLPPVFSAFVLSCSILVFSTVSTAASKEAVAKSTGDQQILLKAKKHIKLKQFSAARELLLPLANAGNVDAQFNLGVMYRNGYLLKKDYKQAFLWLEKAAKQSHVQAIYAIGNMKQRGQGSPRDQAAAIKLFELAESLGYKPATSKLKQIRNKTTTDQLSEKEYAVFRKAIRTGNIPVVKKYLANNIEVNRKDSNGNTALMLAMQSKQQDVISLLSNDPEINQAKTKVSTDYTAINNHGETVLMIAIENKLTQFALSLLKKEAIKSSINMQDKLGNTALMLSIKYGIDEVVSPLISAGANIYLTDKQNRNAYVTAEDKGNKKAMTIFIQAGYQEKNQQRIDSFVINNDSEDPANEKNPYANWSALMVASWRADINAVTDLVKTTEDINRTDEAGHSALSRAAWKGATDIVKILLQHKANVNQKQTDGSTALHWASQYGHLDSVISLVENNANINDARNDGKTPLMLAVLSHQIKLSQYLIDKKAHLDLQDKEGKTALIYAVIENKSDQVKLLLENGAKISVTDGRNRTALWYAVNVNSAEIALLLLDAKTNTGIKANANHIDGEGNYLLTLAADSGNSTLVKNLLDYNANVNSKTRFGNTSLIIAANNASEEIVKYLILYKADLNHKNAIGDTALITAARKGSLEIVSLLLNAGADIKKKNKQRKTALDIAKAANNLPLIKLLEEIKKEKGLWPF